MSDTRQLFDELVEHYYRSWFRYHPDEAISTGVQGYEHLLRAYTDDDIGALITLNQKLVSAFEEIDFDALNTSRKMDFCVLRGAAEIELIELLNRDWRLCNPQKFIPVNSIHLMLTRPVKNVHDALRSRLAQFPEYLRGAKNTLLHDPAQVPALWLRAAQQEAKSGANFIRELTHHPFIQRYFSNPARLQTLLDEAANALIEFNDFLEKEIAPLAQGDFSCGREHFERLLKEVHFLNIDADQLHDFGRKLFEKTREELATLAKETGNDAKWLSLIQKQQPQGNLLDAYRDRMKAAFEHVCDRELLTIPDQQTLIVINTPEFLRHAIPFAAYDVPAPNDETQSGYYYVTPVTDDAQLAEHNRYSIDLTCVHEAWPGHHLQFVTANFNEKSRSLPRLMNPSATMYEGWALYCEQLMQETGFLDQPEHKYIMLRDRLWRAMRVMLDVELHTRSLSIDDAADRMCEHLGFDRQQAMGDLLWYSSSPTIPMSYATGWRLIRELREQQEDEDNYDLKSFHDTLLSNGSVALSLCIREGFGISAWEGARARVFN